MLPVYSVADEKEAKSLLTLACSTNYKGQFVAKELVHKQTLENLELFGERLNEIHQKYIVSHGNCRCK